MSIILKARYIIMRERTFTCFFWFDFFQRLIELITPDLMDKEANLKVLLGDLGEKNGDEILLTSTL